MENTLHDLKAILCRNLQQIVAKGDIVPNEVEPAKHAVCMLKEISEIEKNEAEIYAMDQGISEGRGWNVRQYEYPDDSSYGNNYPNTNFSNRSMPNRSMRTGRFTSNGRDMYSGHSLEDRMIARLQQKYDQTSDENVRRIIMSEIEDLRHGM